MVGIKTLVGYIICHKFKSTIIRWMWFQITLSSSYILLYMVTPKSKYYTVLK